MLQEARPNLLSNDLIQRSVDIVSVTVTFWTHNDTLVGMEGDHEWFIMGYAVPAAVVLCECLVQGNDNGCLASSRSSIIGQLSLLVGFMEWLVSKAPNVCGCYKAKTIIAKVLDRVLNRSSGVFDDSATNSRHQQAKDGAACLHDLRDIDTFKWLV